MIRRIAFGTLVAIAFVLGMFVVDTTTVSAECSTDPFSGETTCFLRYSPVPDRAVALGDPRSSSFVWVSLFWYSEADNPFEIDNDYCRRATVVGLTTTYTYGNIYLVVLRNAATGENVTTPQAVCAFDEDDPALQPPPPPPTEAEFVQAARRLLTVETSLNPRVEIGGLTGLDTWLWCEDPGDVDVSVSLRGWTAAATMTSVEYAWSIDGTDSASRVADACGSEESPAATWMPETMGPYTVGLTTTWAGTWTLTYLGLPAGTFPLGPFEFAAAPVDYPVDEYVGVLTTTPVEGL
jgi:hypothetical protein